MWFIRLVKLKDAPSKESRQAVDRVRAEAERWGIKFHDTFYTLGRYDIISIFEAPDVKAAMRYAIALAPWTRGAETLQAMSRDEVDSWMK